MSGLNYPREWFEVTRYCDDPIARVFIRETEKCLFTGRKRVEKWTQYSRYYPTIEEAQSAIYERNAAKAQRKAENRVRDAAPELLKALEAAVECGIVPVSSVADGGASKHSQQVIVADQIRAAIAKAKGEA
jgi:hypothetical protein